MKTNSNDRAYPLTLRKIRAKTDEH